MSARPLISRWARLDPRQPPSGRVAMVLLLLGGVLLVWVAIAVTVLWLTAPTAATVACTHEDGSGPQAYPCVWDGGQRGNRIGSTYIIQGAPASSR